MKASIFTDLKWGLIITLQMASASIWLAKSLTKNEKV